MNCRKCATRDWQSPWPCTMCGSSLKPPPDPWARAFNVTLIVCLAFIAWLWIDMWEKL